MSLTKYSCQWAYFTNEKNLSAAFKRKERNIYLLCKMDIIINE